MVSALHALHRSGQMKLLGAKLGHLAHARGLVGSLAVEGHRRAPSSLINSALHAGLAHPTELSSSLAYLKEVKLIEEAAKKGG
eukprot:4659799-Amphidinium_carterae.1